MDKFIDYNAKKQEIARLKAEKEKHVADITALYDAMIFEKENELNQEYGDLQCKHEIIFNYVDARSMAECFSICVLCNGMSLAGNYTSDIVVVEDKEHTYTTMEAMEITKLMRAALATLPSLDDKEKIKEVLNSVLRGEEIIRK